MQGFKFVYDEEVDSLLVYREDRVNNASIKLGEIIINLDKNFNVSAIEILNPDLLYKIPKKKLMKISGASIKVQKRGSVYWIYVIIRFEDIKEPEILPVQLQLEQPISV